MGERVSTIGMAAVAMMACSGASVGMWPLQLERPKYPSGGYSHGRSRGRSGYMPPLVQRDHPKRGKAKRRNGQ